MSTLICLPFTLILIKLELASITCSILFSFAASKAFIAFNLFENKFNASSNLRLSVNPSNKEFTLLIFLLSIANRASLTIFTE